MCLLLTLSSSSATEETEFALVENIFLNFILLNLKWNHPKMNENLTFPVI